MRRVTANEVGGKPKAAQPRSPAGDFAAQMQELLAGLDDIRNLQDTHKMITKSVSDMEARLTKEINSIWTRLNKIEAMATAGAQYEKDHDQLHARMAQMESKKSDIAQKALAESIEQTSSMIATFMSSQDESSRGSLMVVMDAVKAMQVAVAQFAGKEISVSIDQPEQQITVQAPAPDKTMRDYDIIRGNNGLISKIKEVTR